MPTLAAIQHVVTLVFFFMSCHCRESLGLSSSQPLAARACRESPLDDLNVRLVCGYVADAPAGLAPELRSPLSPFPSAFWPWATPLAIFGKRTGWNLSLALVSHGSDRLVGKPKGPCKDVL